MKLKTSSSIKRDYCREILLEISLIHIFDTPPLFFVMVSSRYHDGVSIHVQYSLIMQVIHNDRLILTTNSPTIVGIKFYEI